jgi:hypothetical protein
MAFKRSQLKTMNAFRMISRSDPAVDVEASDWERYDKNPMVNDDAIVLKDKEHPTIFLLNFEVNGKERAAIDDAMVAAQNNDGSYVPSYGNWPYAIAKYTLKAIENPEGTVDGFELKKDGRGYPRDEVIRDLQKLGIVSEIFMHWLEYIKAKPGDESKN